MAVSLNYEDVTGVDVDTSSWQYPPRISGANITKIGGEAFAQAFASKSISTFNIGPKVTQIGDRCFHNMKLTYTPLNIGSASELSPLDVTYNSIAPIRQNSPAANVYFYSTLYDEKDHASISTKLVAGDLTLHIT